MDYHERKIREAMGEASHKPWVSFFDKAVPDEKLTEETGRPRFRERIYIQKVPSAPDLPVRDIFTRAMEEEDKAEFPEEWQAYLARKDAIANPAPPIQALPGMDVAAEAELQALSIRTCRDLVAYKGDLDVLEPLRNTAREIMRISDEIRKERSGVRTATEHARPVHLDER